MYETLFCLSLRQGRVRHIQRDPDETTRLGNVRASHTQLDKEDLREKYEVGVLITSVFAGGTKGVRGVPSLCTMHLKIF